MRILFGTQSKQDDPRPISANLLLLDSVRNRPNSTSSYTFGHKHSSDVQANPTNNDPSGKLTVGSRNNRPLSATPSMIAGGKRYVFTGCIKFFPDQYNC